MITRGSGILSDLVDEIDSEPRDPRYAPRMSEQCDLEGQPGTRTETRATTDSVSGASKERPQRRGPPPNPLYHPLFLPILLVGFSLWFGWDGFLTSDPDMLRHQTFNRVMFVIMLPICLWMVPRGLREFREDQAEAAKKQSGGKSS